MMEQTVAENAWQVEEGLFRILLPLPWSVPFVNAYVLHSRGEYMLIDCGLNWSVSLRALGRALKAIGVKHRGLSIMLLTHRHPDHASGAGPVHARWGGRVLLHPADMGQFCPTPAEQAEWARSQGMDEARVRRIASEWREPVEVMPEQVEPLGAVPAAGPRLRGLPWADDLGGYLPLGPEGRRRRPDGLFRHDRGGGGPGSPSGGGACGPHGRGFVDAMRAKGGAVRVGERPWVRFYKPGTGSDISFPSVLLFRVLQATAEAHPDLTALAFRDRQITYGALWHQVNQMAHGLISLGLKKGDRVMLMLPNCPAYVIAYYGTLRAGGIVTQVNPLYTEREVRHLAEDSGARVLVVADALYGRVRHLADETALSHVVVAELAVGAELLPNATFLRELLARSPALEPDVEVAPDDVAVLQYTGGTTGIPKGAMLTHRNLVANAYQSSVGSEVQPGEARVLMILPLFHSFGMLVMNVGLKHGSRLVLLPRFEIQEVMHAIRDHQITDFPGVPTMYVAVLNYPNAEAYGISGIKNISSGGAAMPVEVMETFVHRFGASIGEGYGLSEASPATHANPSWDRTLRKPGSIGIPLHGTDARIVDLETGSRVLGPGEEGELCIRGPQVMAGYWNRPEETRAALRDGWLYTGDIAKMDEDGYFYIVDRKKDLIIVSGYNVYPREVEEVLYQHPAVLEAAVIGVPDAYKGEVPKAFIALKPGCQALAEEITAYCRERLAPFKVPREIEFRQELPKSAVGKLLKRELAAEERRRRQAESHWGSKADGDAVSESAV